MSLRPDSQIRISGEYKDFDFEVGCAWEIGYFIVLKPKVRFGIQPIVVKETEMAFLKDCKPYVRMDESETLHQYMLQEIAIRGYRLRDDEGLFRAVNQKLEQVYQKVQEVEQAKKTKSN